MANGPEKAAAPWHAHTAATVAALAALLPLLASAGCGSSTTEISAAAERVPAAEANLQVKDPPDAFYVKTDELSLPSGEVEVTVSGCPPSTEIVGAGLPSQVNGNPAFEQGFQTGEDETSATFRLENQADEPVGGRFVLACSSSRAD